MIMPEIILTNCWGLIQDLNLGSKMNVLMKVVRASQNVKKILQKARSFEFCFMFSLDKYAFL